MNRLTVILKIAERQASQAFRIGSLLTARRVPVEHKGFPGGFLGLNDISADYVAQAMLTKQPKRIAAIGECVRLLSADREGQRLGRQIFADEEEYLRQLQRVVGGPTKAPNNLAAAA